MKRTFQFLIFLFVCFYFPEGYRRIIGEENMEKYENLSAIAQSVSAIRLENGNNINIDNITKVLKEKNHLYILSDGSLYQFDMHGHFLHQYQPTSAEEVATDFVIIPTSGQIVALTSMNEALYYDLNGDLLGKITIPIKSDWLHVGRLSYYNDSIYTVVTRTVNNSNDNLSNTQVEQWLYRLDLSFQTIEARQIQIPDCGRTQLNYGIAPELGIKNNEIYVHYQAMQPNYLVQDTISILDKGYDITKEMLPFKQCDNYLIANYHNPLNPQNDYFFYYDNETNKSHMVKNGLKDDFYAGGRICDMHSLDLRNNELYYTRTLQNKDTILYIITLKS